MADDELFCEFAQLTRGNLRSTNLAKLPLDEHLPVAMADPKIAGLLIWFPNGNRGSSSGNNKPEKPEPQHKPNNKQKNKLNNKGSKGSKGKGNGKGTKKAFVKLPAELSGLHTEYKGTRICFAFNIQGCKKNTSGKPLCCGEGSSKLAHVCARCFG